MYHTLMIIEDK